MALADPVDLSISSDYLAQLILRVRGLEGREAFVDPQSGSNATDDNMIDALQEEPGDLSRAEVVSEIGGLNDRQQAELVALLWMGRGDAEPEEWEATVALARDRRDSPTPGYLLQHPLLAEYWEEGAARLGVNLPAGNG